MKKLTILAFAAAGMLLTSCGTATSALGTAAGTLLQSAVTNKTANNTNTTTNVAKQAGSVLGGLLSNLLGGTAQLNDQAIVGTWNYQGIDCAFESENLLKQAGGELMASTIEKKVDTQLQKFGIKPGACSFTFNADHTYRATISGKSLNGNWTLDPQTKRINMTYLLGVGTLNPHVSYTGGKLSLLFESSKLLTLVKGVGALTGNSTISTVSNLLGSYDGMYIGLRLAK